MSATIETTAARFEDEARGFFPGEIMTLILIRLAVYAAAVAFFVWLAQFQIRWNRHLQHLKAIRLRNEREAQRAAIARELADNDRREAQREARREKLRQDHEARLAGFVIVAQTTPETPDIESCIAQRASVAHLN